MSTWIFKPLKKIRSRGSVLILVVALLVLLALIGTAYISTTRVDRFTTGQNATNTEIDVQMNGLVNSIQYAITSDLFDQYSHTYRSPQQLTATTDTYVNTDSPLSKLWLADRIPDLANNTVAWSATPAPGTWNSISWPLMPPGASAVTPGQLQFDQPIGGPSVVLPAWTVNTNIFPTPTPSAKLNLRYTPTNLGNFPALQVNGGTAFMAADTDADGIADAGFWRLPTVVDGITYYAAYRVVDNSAAINVNTAWSLTSDFDAGSASTLATPAVPAVPINVSFFPSNVGLLELLDPNAPPGEMGQLNKYRLNLSTWYDPNIASPQADFQGSPIARLDFSFLTQGDELYHQLGRRIGFPGYNGSQSLMQSVGASDGIALASQFCIRNQSSSSYLETSLLNTSINNSNKAPTSAYDPSQSGPWFKTNFNFTSPSDLNVQTPLRALLTTYNGASNRTGAKVFAADPKGYGVINPQMLPYDAPVWSSSASYVVGDWVKWAAIPVTIPASTQSQWMLFHCIKTGPSETPGLVPNSTTWLNEPYTATPVRTSINTATFPELWRSYYNVMSDQWNTAPNTAVGNVLPRKGVAMFKNSMRGSSLATSTLPVLSDIQMVQLRAALAAVNAMDQRDTDNDITSRTIKLIDDPTIATPALTPAPTVQATVYGAEKQLFITKVVAYTDGNGYFWTAIELHNPYLRTPQATALSPQATSPTIYLGQAPAVPPVAGEVDIGLGLRIAFVDRSKASPVVTEITPPAWGTMKVPPGGYVVLCTDPTKGYPSGVDGTVLTAGAALSPPTVVQVTGLEKFFSGGVANGGPPLATPVPPGEVVLFRTHAATGIPKSNAAAPDPQQQYDETTNIQDNIPMDQFDMSTATVPAAGAPTEYYYARPSEPTPAVTWTPAPGDFWKCVFPLAPGAPYPRMAGGEAGAVVPAATVITFLLPEATVAGKPWHQIQLNNVDWPSPVINTAGKKVYPVQGFPRNGDMLQVPFIGSYVIKDLTSNVMEINSVTMDALYAEDSNDVTAPTATTDDPNATTTGVEMYEQVGRFCPLTAAPSEAVLPLSPGETVDPYGWSSRLFDFFTVQTPHYDFLPNVDPVSYVQGASPPAVPTSTANSFYTANFGEDAVPVQGQLNINSADWKALSMLPLVHKADGSVDLAGCASMAKLIVAYREKNGPFQSIFDLNKVEDVTMAKAAPSTEFPGFRNGYVSAGLVNMDFRFIRTATTNDVDARQGDLSPNGEGTAALPALPAYPSFLSTPTAVAANPTDGVTADFKEKFLALTRISNLITTRSDTFTCYALVQGWRDGQMVSQRRSAFIIDRSGVGYQFDPLTGSRMLNMLPSIAKVPTN